MAQYRTDKNEYLSNGSTIFETQMIATDSGDIVSLSNPLPVAVTSSQPTPSTFATLNNFDINQGTGFAIQDDYVPVFGLRVKPGSGTTFNLVSFQVTLNGGLSVTVGYVWHKNATLDSSYSWTDLGSTGIQYVQLDDVDGTPNEITSNTAVHSRTLVGKSTSDLTSEMKEFPFTDGGIEMFLEIKRLDGGAKQDFWYDMTMAIQ